MNNKIDSSKDRKITKLTVRLKDNSTKDYIGSGVIYFQDNFNDKVYILTASHCLFTDGDNFQNQRDEISIDLLKSNFTDYETITIPIVSTLLFTIVAKDVAVLVLKKKDVENIIGEIPKLNCIKERSTYDRFVTKGFPMATLGEEIAVLYPNWLQSFEKERFQIQLNEPYSAYSTEGFSGSPVFLVAKKEIYLYGIFTRFRGEDKGKVIYCQYIEVINELLEKKYLPLISFDYFGNFGLTKDFFKKHINNSIVGLGPRFTEELNFKLPIAKCFNDIARDSVFFNRLLKVVDDWIVNNRNNSIQNNFHLDDIEETYKQFISKITEWIKKLENQIQDKIDIEWIFESIKHLEPLIDSKLDELYKLRREEEKLLKDIQKDYNYKPPYETEINRLRKVSRTNHDFFYELKKKVNINLANTPYLIIKGEAGNGKSHLLGDIAKTRIDANLPTILILGQNLIKNKTIWENINSELDISCSKSELLSELNNIGKQIGSRVVFMVDAINEGAGAVDMLT